MAEISCGKISSCLTELAFRLTKVRNLSFLKVGQRIWLSMILPAIPLLISSLSLMARPTPSFTRNLIQKTTRSPSFMLECLNQWYLSIEKGLKISFR